MKVRFFLPLSPSLFFSMLPCISYGRRVRHWFCRLPPLLTTQAVKHQHFHLFTRKHKEVMNRLPASCLWCWLLPWQPKLSDIFQRGYGFPISFAQMSFFIFVGLNFVSSGKSYLSTSQVQSFEKNITAAVSLFFFKTTDQSVFRPDDDKRNLCWANLDGSLARNITCTCVCESVFVYLCGALNLRPSVCLRAGGWRGSWMETDRGLIVLDFFINSPCWLLSFRLFADCGVPLPEPCGRRECGQACNEWYVC